MFDFLRYKLTGKVPHYSRLLKIAERYGWLVPEIEPAAVYIAALAYNGTELSEKIRDPFDQAQGRLSRCSG
jgi:hypothetical protein